VTVVRVQPLETDLRGPASPLWWGVAMLLIIEAVAYATLFTAYLYLRFHSPEWPTEGLPRPSPVRGGLSTVLLLGSAGMVWWGSADRDGTRTGRGFAVAGALAALSFAALAWERLAAGFRWDFNAYASVIWTIDAVHGLHLVALASIGFAVARVTREGTEGSRTGLDALALYWYGVTLVWLPLFAVVYLVAW
jgi:heme/copper-type cytochrome/quinol oxidase subunit 3